MNRGDGDCPCPHCKKNLNNDICLVFNCHQMSSTIHNAINFVWFFSMNVCTILTKQWVHQTTRFYKSSIHLATQKHGEAFLDKKLHCNGVWLINVTIFALCQVDGVKGGSKGCKKSHVMDQGKLKGVHFKPKEKYESIASTDCNKKSHVTDPDKLKGVHFKPIKCPLLIAPQGQRSFFW